MTRQQIIDDFHKLYYGPYDVLDTENVRGCTFMGAPVLKCPTDLWIYQEIIHELHPGLIIECGSSYGGSAFYMAHMMDLAKCPKNAKIISIDVLANWSFKHKRIKWVLCDSTHPPFVEEIREEARKVDGHVIVILDSDHSKNHVLDELNAYHDIVTPGSYLIVEDSNVNGHPVLLNHGDGPWEALTEWLPSHPEFSPDTYRERFLMTYNSGGYLKKQS